MKNKMVFIGIAIALFSFAAFAQTGVQPTQWTYNGDNGVTTGPNSGSITIIITQTRNGYEVSGAMSRHGISCPIRGRYVVANSQVRADCVSVSDGFRAVITGTLRRDKDQFQLTVSGAGLNSEEYVARRFTGTKTNSKDISGRYNPTVRFSGSGTWIVPWSTGECTLNVNETASSLKCKGTDSDYGHKPTSYNGIAGDCTVTPAVMTCKSWKFDYKDTAKDISGTGTATLSYGGDTLTITSTLNEKAKQDWHPPYYAPDGFTPWAAKGISLVLKRD